MKSSIGNGSFDLIHQAFRQPAFEEAEREIDQITLSEHLDQREPQAAVQDREQRGIGQREEERGGDGLF